MQFGNSRFPDLEGQQGSSQRRPLNKNLICLWPPDLNGDNLLQELSDAGWGILRAKNDDELNALLSDKQASLGLILVDGSWQDENLREIPRTITRAAHMTWYAVLADRRPMSTAVCNLVAVYCEDFFSPPYDSRRIKQSLGHGAGMSQLRQQSLQSHFSPPGFEGMIGHSSLMTHLFRDIQKVAKSDAPVLLHGESGTGKELTARAIHHLSRRSNGPFKVVNCAAVPPGLIQSELFGHEKGAFTGAQSRHTGRFESAQGGVIFLDEISDMPLEQQVNLLRFLEDKCIERLGGSHKIELDVRVIAATHDQLFHKVKAGSFREDLYYRLNVLHIELPSLRERPEDIEALTRFALLSFAEEAGNRGVRGFTREALAALQAHPWPGNVRELINRVRRAMVMAEGPMITAADLELAVDNNSQQLPQRPLLMTLEDYRKEAERTAITTALTLASNNISQAARRLNISRTTLYRMMEKLDIPTQNMAD